MKKQFELIADIRTNVLKTIEKCMPEQLFTIPKGFNNHIFWNAAHLLATHQILIYTFSGTQEFLDKDFIKKYAKGTFPDEAVNESEIAYLKANLFSSLEQSQQDWDKQIFGTYKPVTTSFGSTLNSVEDAIHYLVLHEAMHFGQIKTFEKLLV